MGAPIRKKIRKGNRKKERRNTQTNIKKREKRESRYVRPIDSLDTRNYSQENPEGRSVQLNM
jgi:hypothetical protein